MTFNLIFIILLIFKLIPYITETKIYSVKKQVTYNYKIPKIIFRTHGSSYISSAMYNYCHKAWLDLNPKHSMIWYDNSMCKKFMKSMDPEIYKAYNSLDCNAYKADLWRACILYRDGGIYLDSYSTPFCSLSSMFQGCYNINSEHQFISVQDRDQWGIHNGFICCTPKHPFMFQYIKDIVENIEKKFYGKTDLDITGPICLLKSINNVIKSDKKRHEIGWNNYGNLSFYLFEHGNGLYKPIYKNRRLIINKKYSIFSFIWQKWFNYKTAYPYKWKSRSVYVNNNLNLT